MSLAMQCESCGRPLASREEHGAQNLDNPYCIHCTDMKGKLLPFEKLYDDMVASAMQTRWMNKEQAEQHALAEMGKWPARKDRVDKMLKRQYQPAVSTALTASIPFPAPTAHLPPSSRLP